MKYDHTFKIQEYYNEKKQNGICDLSLNYKNIKYNLIPKSDDDKPGIREYEATISTNFFFSDLWINGVRLLIECEKDGEIILDSAFKSYIFLDYSTNVLVNQLNYKEDNNKKFIYQNSSYTVILDKSEPLVDDYIQDFDVTASSIYNDCKGLFDFNSEISSLFKSNIINWKRINIDTKNKDYMFSFNLIKSLEQILMIFFLNIN